MNKVLKALIDAPEEDGLISLAEELRRRPAEMTVEEILAFRARVQEEMGCVKRARRTLRKAEPVASQTVPTGF